MTERVLDWKPRFDTRSLGHKVSLAYALERPLRARIWKRTVWLDQGSEGACVGFSCAHEMALTPRRWSPEYTEQMARVLYREAQKRDQWAGESYEGSSVLGGMQALKDRGEIKSYRWCTTVEEVLWAVSYIGPVVIGVNWYAGMFAPDANGHLHTKGRLAGGHAIVIGGIDPKNERVLLYNSWGKGWGKDGAAWLSFAELDRLLHEDGEFAVPLKTRLVV
jgi:hypothetical protein